jgi:two-component system, OmpR family, sensor kinase
MGRPLSLQARLLAGMAVIAIVLAVAAVAIAQLTRRHLISQIDAQLRATRAAPFFDSGPGEPPSEAFAGFLEEDGTLALVSRGDLFDETPSEPELTLEEIEAGAQSRVPFTVRSVGGDERFRVLVRPTQRGPFVVGLSMSNVEEAVRRLIVIEVITTTAILGVLSLVTWWVIRLGVRPIKQMTATATAIAGSDGNLSPRVPDVAPGTEAGDLGAALNQMLGRIEYAFDQRTRSENRLRQFVGDASHELRTPITTIRGYAELYRAGGLDDTGEMNEAMRRTEQEAIRMGTLVDDLLLLARLDSGRPLQRDPVELSGLVVDAVNDAHAAGREHRWLLDLPDAAVTVPGDGARLHQVLANLLANARVHTPPGTTVTTSLDVLDGWATVTVADNGPGIPEPLRPDIFERFARGDTSRSRAAGSTGLGLAIVAAVVEAHEGRVEVTCEPGRTAFEVRLPGATTRPED